MVTFRFQIPNLEFETKVAPVIKQFKIARLQDARDLTVTVGCFDTTLSYTGEYNDWLDTLFRNLSVETLKRIHLVINHCFKRQLEASDKTLGIDSPMIDLQQMKEFSVHCDFHPFQYKLLETEQERHQRICDSIPEWVILEKLVDVVAFAELQPDTTVTVKDYFINVEKYVNSKSVRMQAKLRTAIKRISLHGARRRAAITATRNVIQTFQLDI